MNRRCCWTLGRLCTRNRGPVNVVHSLWALRSACERVVAAGAGFLLAVLWFDLMFDVQVLRGEPERAVESISAYYRRVTTDARPMNMLVGAAMAGTPAAIVVQIAAGEALSGVGWATPSGGGAALGLAGVHTFPAAVRLGARRDPPEAQVRLARAVCRDHLVCFPAIAAVIVIQLVFG
jgi:hypothetical protein